MRDDQAPETRISVTVNYDPVIARLACPILLLLVFAFPVCAQEFVAQQVVFPITNFRPDLQYLAPFSVKFGTGFCLDPDCRFVGTNYHVAKLMGKYVRIKGVRAVHLYLDSAPNDSGAREVKFVWGGSMSFNPAHDLAIYEMGRPLKNFHGIAFDKEDLESSAEVDIYGYPFDWNPKRRLVRWHGKFVGNTRDGMLAFCYQGAQVSGGASGGIVVNSKTKKIVGILSSISESRDDVAFAVPVKDLSDFVKRAQPYLQITLFPKTVFVSPIAADLYPPFVQPRGELSQRVPETSQVIKLRHTAQHLADAMRNFTAIETLSWGHDNREPDLTEAYETLISDGWQRWRRLSDGKWFYDESPLPRFWLNPSIGTGDLWIRLPGMVGTELNLEIHQAPDAIMGGRTVHVFQYAANAEDQVCRFWWSRWPFGDVTKSYDCHGEVWTDESGIILRISEAFDLSGPLYRFWGVMTYGWVEKDGAKYLVPLTFATQAEDRKTYWCRGLFTDYDMFGVRTRLVLPTETEQRPKSAVGAQ